MKKKREIYIMILSHGKLAEEFYNTAKMIVGSVDNVYPFSFMKEMAFQTFEKVIQFVEKNKAHDMIIFTDLFGGSCFNICSSLVNKKNVRIMSGLNLGVLLEAILLKKSNSLDEVMDALERKKNDTIIYVNKKLIK